MLRSIWLAGVLACALAAAAEAAPKPPTTAAGWAVTPIGRQLSVPRSAKGFQGPIGMALSPGGSKVLTLSSGVQRTNSADLFDLRFHKRTGTVSYDAAKGGAVFYGAAFSPDGLRAYASGGGENVIHVYSVGAGLKETAQIPAPYFPAGMAYGRTPVGDRLYVANNLGGPPGTTNPPGHTVTTIDPATNQVTHVIDLGIAAQPFGVAFERHGRKAYVTNWLGRSVSVINTATESLQGTLALSGDPLVADHPSAIAANPRRDEMYTANANSDTVSVINTRSDTVVATIDVSLARGALPGATPNGIVASPDGKRLYVALAGENAIAVIGVAKRRVLGFIPTGWYPTDVRIAPNGKRLIVLSVNAAGNHPTLCAGPYATGDCTTGDLAYIAKSIRPSDKGAVAVLKLPTTKRALTLLTRQVKRNNRVNARVRRKPAWLRAIKHVIYVIKENRTYDQIYGDLGKGNGDPSLTLFKDDTAPNHRELARRFTLFDNFYADADVSADGHSWMTAAGVSDYTTKTWPITYSMAPRGQQRARDFEFVESDARYLSEPLPLDTSVFRGASALVNGYLWDNAYAHGVSYRDYGEMTDFGDCHGPNNESTVTHLDDTRFGDHVDERYPGFNLACADHTKREPEWEREFDDYVAQYQADPSQDPLPQLEFVRLPSDHTFATRADEATPEAYMADNDLALGRLVEAVSHSPFWSSTAIFVTEDDAQNGPDHVDSHRTVALVISPYTQTHRVDSTHYDTASMVATIEDVLGLPPMAIADQRAVRMWHGFSAKPVADPYDALMPSVVPFGEFEAPRNASTAPFARASETWNLSVEDATPEIGLNEAIWKSIKGRKSEMPEPRHQRIIGQRPVDADG